MEICFYVQSNSLYFLVILLLSLVMGIVLNFTMFLCTIVNSALTTTIVGVLKGVVSTVCTGSYKPASCCRVVGEKKL